MTIGIYLREAQHLPPTSLQFKKLDLAGSIRAHIWVIDSVPRRVCVGGSQSIFLYHIHVSISISLLISFPF